MVYEAKGKWKTIKLPKSQSKHNSLCKGIEVLDNYVLQVGNKRKPEILDAPLTQIKKKKNAFEENEVKDENENCATPGKYVLANGNQNNKEDTVNVTKEEKGKKKNRNKNNIKDAKTEEKKVESENKNENNKKKRKHKKKEKKPIINLDVIAEFLKKKEAGPTVVEADSNVVKAGPNVVEADSTTEEPKNEEVKNKNKTKKVNKAGKVKAENKTEKVKVNKNTEKVKVNKNTEKVKVNKNIEEKDKDESEVEDETEEVANETEEVADENKTEEVNEEKDKNKDLDMSEWKKLHVCDEIIEALRVKGFSKPTEIQKLALPSALSGVKDIVGAAETGSGKTLVFAIPMIQGILKARQRELEGVESEDETEKMEYENDQESDQENEDDEQNDESETDDEEDIDPIETHEEIKKRLQREKLKKKLDKESGKFRDMPLDMPINSKHFLDMYGRPVAMPDDQALSDSEDTVPQPVIKKNQVGKEVHFNSKLSGLIMTPTRELAVQIRDHIKEILTMTNITIAVIVGGMSAEKQLRLLKRCPDIVVGTPGRIWELYKEGVPHLQNIQNIRYFAIDETDRMGEKGHFADLEHLLEVLSTSKKKMQRFVMSATLSLVHKKPFYKNKVTKQLTAKQKLKQLMEFAGIGQERKIVDITLGAKTADKLRESVIHCDVVDKDFYLYYFVTHYKGRTIAFCNSIEAVKRLASVFRLLEVKTFPLHAKMHQRARLKNLDAFVAEENCLLIATDVAARGLDIPNIDHIIHYQAPRTCEGYIHRSGRTARAHNTGISVLFLDPKEVQYYKRIRDTLKRTEDLPMFPVDQVIFKATSERVRCAQRLDKLMHKVKKAKREEAWYNENAVKAGLVVTDSESEDELDKWEKEDAYDSVQNALEETKEEMKYLLNRTIYRVNPSKYPSQRGAVQMKNTPVVAQNAAIEALDLDLDKNRQAMKELAARQKKFRKLRQEQMKERAKEKRNF